MARYARSAGLDGEVGGPAGAASSSRMWPRIWKPGRTRPRGGGAGAASRTLRRWRIKPFNCLYMMPARKSLGFDCGSCAARPQGIRVARRQSAETGSAPHLYTDNSFQLEHALADQLLACALRHGPPSPADRGWHLPAHRPAWTSGRSDRSGVWPCLGRGGRPAPIRPPPWPTGSTGVPSRTWWRWTRGPPGLPVRTPICRTPSGAL